MTAELHVTIALACRILANEGLSRVSFGHVSARTEPDGDLIAMKGRSSSDSGLQFADSGDIVEMNLDGTVLSSGDVLPPREFPLHLELYRARPDVQSVVHVHPRRIVALRAAGIELLPIYGAYDPDGLQLARHGIAYFKSAQLIDSAEAGRELAATLGDHSVCVMDGHGIATVGPTIESAVLRAIALEELAHVVWLAAAAGTPQPISDVDQGRFDQPAQRSQPPSDAQRSVPPAPVAWQHYVERDRLLHR